MPDGQDTIPGRGRGRGRRKSSDSVEGRLRPHNPFELIRWLALSQPDPRKALAELVQNSLDAGATKIRITRQREKREPALRILDNGDGVIPEMDRPEALKYIATHIGHSRKKSLSPQERLELMTQGQYGIGLLGFWSLGQMLEMRTAVPGQRSSSRCAGGCPWRRGGPRWSSPGCTARRWACWPPAGRPTTSLRS